MKPATPLPWGMARDYEIRSKHTRENGYSSEYIATLIQSNYRYERMDELVPNAAYIVHAANTYHELVAALRSCINAASTDKIEDFSVVSEAVDDAARLLKRIGEL